MRISDEQLQAFKEMMEHTNKTAPQSDLRYQNILYMAMVEEIQQCRKTSRWRPLCDEKPEKGDQRLQLYRHWVRNGRDFHSIKTIATFDDGWKILATGYEFSTSELLEMHYLFWRPLPTDLPEGLKCP